MIVSAFGRLPNGDLAGHASRFVPFKTRNVPELPQSLHPPRDSGNILCSPFTSFLTPGGNPSLAARNESGSTAEGFGGMVETRRGRGR